MTAFHVLTAEYNGLDQVSLVHGDMFQCLSASGPIKPMFIDNGPVCVGQMLTLPYNYDTDEYASRDGGWRCQVIRINRKTITVRSDRTRETHKVQVIL